MIRKVLSLLGSAVFALSLIASMAPAPVIAAQSAPSTIRVGRSCSCRSCSTVVTVSMETYVKRVLPNEWISGWNAESLKAGAVAIRSYGAWHVYHPDSSSFDICDNTCCQKYGTTQYTSTNNATDATAGIYMVDTNGNITRAEYSAENNNTGCGNCYTGTCLSDSVCCGFAANGHGRGMCQWGTQRWASTQGRAWTWICDKYYAQYNWTRQNLTGGGGTPVNIIVDNSSAGFTASANWSTGTSATDKYGSNYRFRSTAALSDAATWTANITSAGNYTISAWWAQGTNRSVTAPYIMPNGTSVSKNQQSGGGVWNVLGTQSLSTGNAATKLSCWTTTGFIVLADAIKYTK